LIPFDQLEAVAKAGHPDTALVAIPMSLVRELLTYRDAAVPARVRRSKPVKRGLA
jgi:hypothetical protein